MPAGKGKGGVIALLAVAALAASCAGPRATPLAGGPADAPPATYPTSPPPGRMAVRSGVPIGDLDGDGFPEVAVDAVRAVPGTPPGATVADTLTVRDGRTGRVLWTDTGRAIAADGARVQDARLGPGGRPGLLVARDSGLVPGPAVTTYTALDRAGRTLWTATSSRSSDSVTTGVPWLGDLNGNRVDDLLLPGRPGSATGMRIVNGVDGTSRFLPLPARATDVALVPDLTGRARHNDIVVDRTVRSSGALRLQAQAYDGATGRLLWQTIPGPAGIAGGSVTDPRRGETWAAGRLAATAPVAGVDVTGDGGPDLVFSGHGVANLHPSYLGVLDGRNGATRWVRSAVMFVSVAGVPATAAAGRRALVALLGDQGQEPQQLTVVDGMGRTVWRRALPAGSWAGGTADVTGDGVGEVGIASGGSPPVGRLLDGASGRSLRGGITVPARPGESDEVVGPLLPGGRFGIVAAVAGSASGRWSVGAYDLRTGGQVWTTSMPLRATGPGTGAVSIRFAGGRPGQGLLVVASRPAGSVSSVGSVGSVGSARAVSVLLAATGQVLWSDRP